MPKVKDLDVDDLEQLIEQKVLEILGDPDSGLELKTEFKRKLKERLEKPHKLIPHEEVLKEQGDYEKRTKNQVTSSLTTFQNLGLTTPDCGRWTMNWI
jgi:hypothetical protein